MINYAEMLKEFNWQFSAGLNTSAIGQEHHTQTTALDVIFRTLTSLQSEAGPLLSTVAVPPFGGELASRCF